MSRREFIRYATLLGMAAGTAYGMAGMAAPAMAAGTLPFPAAEPGAKRGGRLRVGEMVARMDDPATYNWNEMGNQTRPILDYLTMVGADNVVRPMLLESWLPSADLKTWTLHVRNGVMWHNGEELNAEHVAWNIRRWSDPALGSSNLGLSTFAALTEFTGDKDAKGKPARRPLKNGVEVLDSRTVRLNLARPVLSVAEDCGEFPTLVVHPSFKAPLSRNPIGTGPYTLAELRVGDRCILKRITKTTDGKDFRYWGGDVYLDEIHFYHYEQENQTAALASGSVDAIYEVSVEQIELAQSIPGAQLLSVETAQTLCCRMQVDVKPFDDIRVRRAVVKAADNAAIKRLVFGEHGLVANNFHVAPVHPEYFPLPPVVRDVAGARQLLKEAGYDKGHRSEHRGRQQRRSVAAGRLRSAARSGQGGRDQSRRHGRAGDEVLGNLDQGTVRRHLLGTPAARHHGARAGLSQRRILERKPLFRSGVRPGARGRRGDARCRGAQGEDAEGRKDSAGCGRRGSAVLAAGLHPCVGQGAWLQGSSGAPNAAQQGLDELNRLMGTLVVRRVAQMLLIMLTVSLLLFAIFDSDQFRKKVAVAELGRIWRGDPVGQRLPRVARRRRD